MRLAELLQNLGGANGREWPDQEVEGLAYDSRKVKRNSIFVAVRGEKFDGNDYVEQAASQGAIAVVSERPRPAQHSLLWVQVESARQALASLAAVYYERPAEKLQLIGITGTNGKTSTAYLVESMVKATGSRCGLISTIEYRGPEHRTGGDRTTPESLDLHATLADFVRQRCDFAVMEVSSHALALDRVYGLGFRTAVFTNLSQDHLDFHRSMENYFEAKAKLFLGMGVMPPAMSVINHDDPYGVRLEQICQGRCLTYSLQSKADFLVAAVNRNASGMELRVTAPRGTIDVTTPLFGRTNQSNILAALAVGYDLGFEDRALLQGVRQCSIIPGRFERVDQGQPFLVFVDYAHTPDALEKVLRTARELNPNRLLLLFGCGGERDRGKRPLMANVAEELSDECVVTSDNPRGEDPAVILQEIEAGFKRKPLRYVIEEDRKKAIALILSKARWGDVVILAGKGHETYQILRDGTVHFDDREEARRAMDAMGYSA
ncbi:MAG: UDP-N-acetylmuramoyl-L-alanyl-D-glutamate--2,6-diaminopimelate ligase [Terriglobia bacterium]